MFNRGTRRFEQAMQRAVDANPAVEQRLRVVSKFQPGDIDKERARRITEAEPRYVLHALARYLPHHREVVDAALQPVFEHAERRGVTFNRQLLADIIVQMQISFSLLPREQHSQSSTAELTRLLESMLKISRK